MKAANRQKCLVDFEAFHEICAGRDGTRSGEGFVGHLAVKEYAKKHVAVVVLVVLAHVLHRVLDECVELSAGRWQSDADFHEERIQLRVKLRVELVRISIVGLKIQLCRDINHLLVELQIDFVYDQL